MLRDMIVISALVALGNLAVVGIAHASESRERAQSGEQVMEHTLNAIIDSHISTRRMMGGAVLVARNGQVLVKRGYGFANIPWKVPNSPNTRFRIASISKVFTSALVLLLREQGKLTLEDEVCTYLSRCPSNWSRIRIWHLLAHTSGIVDGPMRAPAGPGVCLHEEPERILRYIEKDPLLFEPGTTYRYSNAGYFLLGLIVERVTGKPYGEALRALILDPLNMIDTGYDDSDSIIERSATGYIWRDGRLLMGPCINSSWLYAAAGIYSTVEDLLAFDNALSTNKLLPLRARREMWTSRSTGNYGYGWQLGNLGNRECVGHIGAVVSFVSKMIRCESDGIFLVVLSNMPGDFYPLINDLLSSILGENVEVSRP